MSHIALLAHEYDRIGQLSSALDKTLVVEQTPDEWNLEDSLPGFDRDAFRQRHSDFVATLAHLVDPHRVPAPPERGPRVPGVLVGRIRAAQRAHEFISGPELAELATRLQDVERPLSQEDVALLDSLARITHAAAGAIEQLIAEH